MIYLFVLNFGCFDSAVFISVGGGAGAWVATQLSGLA